MPTAKGFTAGERQQIDRAIRDAERQSRFEFSVYVGPVRGEPRAFAEGLLGSLVAPTRSVVIAVDPARRVVQVVTGQDVKRDLTDPEVGLAVVAMQSSFAAGDFAGGFTQGLRMLAEHATRPTALHTA